MKLDGRRASAYLLCGVLVGIEELKARARSRASTLEVDETLTIESLRTEAMGFFVRVPEPPVYRRRDDPAIAQANALVAEGETLLARGYALDAQRVDPTLGPWLFALEQHLVALHWLQVGKIEAAERPWRDALEAERTATASKRLWSRSDQAPRPVFDRASARSRFDPMPEASLKVKLVCPRCQKPGDYACSPRHATHPLVCQACRMKFWAYFAEVRACEVQPLGRGRRYIFRLEELSGAQTRLQVDDWGRDALTVARRDLLAFLYAPEHELRGVLNLNSSRVLWLTDSRCFVATVAFGEDTDELSVLRAFRDRVLRHRVSGRAFIDWYYRVGPSMASVLARQRALRWATRVVLRVVVSLIRRGLA